MVLYCFGALGLAWGILYALLVSDSPQADRRIHPVERDFILTSQRGSMSDLRQPIATESVSEVLRQAMCSRAVWALICANFCNNFGFYMLVSELPTFMLNVFHINEEISGILSSAPYACLWLVTIGSGVFADWMVKRAFFKTVKVRRLCFAIAELPPALLLAIAGYVSEIPSLTCLFVGIACNGFYNCAVSANVIDIGGRNSAVVYALTNTAGTIPAIVAEPIFGVATDRFGYKKGFQISSGFAADCILWVPQSLYWLHRAGRFSKKRISDKL
jgi:MFS family permease